MKKTALAIITFISVCVGYTYFVDPCAMAAITGKKECKASGEKCGLDVECCSKFCKPSRTLKTCK